MNKLRSAFSPEVTKLILRKYPIVKKRSAIWFFTNEFKNSWSQTNNDDGSATNIHGPHVKSKGLKRCDINHLWFTMDPESKRKYFNMAEFDEVRYKEQRCLWIAEVGSLLAKYGNDVEKLEKLLPCHEKTDREFLDSLEKYQRNYEKMIQAESTRTLYRDLIGKFNTIMPTDKLMSSVPENYRHILSRPRRPPTPFLLYARDNKERLMSLRKEGHPETIHVKLASSEWRAVSPEVRKAYEDKYNSLLDEYNKAMTQFKTRNSELEGSSLEEASKEKKAFRKSLRRRLRGFAAVPVNIRNAFNFFLMDNKNIPLKDLTKIWRELPEEDKAKYNKLNREDVLRYFKEKESYDDIIKGLNELFKRAPNKKGP